MKIHPIQQQFNTVKQITKTVFCGKAKNKKPVCDSFERSSVINSKNAASEKPDIIFSTLEKMGEDRSRFRSFDFEKEGLVLSLNYPREAFIEDVASILEGLSEEEKRRLYSEFHFQLIKNEDKKLLEGYPQKSTMRLNDGLNGTRQRLNQTIQKFSKNNPVQIEGEEELSEQLTLLFGAMPELYTTVGKKQNKTHDFTLDIHTLNVLQKTMNNPKYQALSDEDKKTMQMAALLHDISKKEGINDELHAETGAIAAYSILERLNMPKEKRRDVPKLIFEHEWLKNYNSPNKNKAERLDYVKSLAQRLKKGNLAKMEAILTESDMKSVKRDGAFFKHYKEAFIQGTTELAEFTEQIKNSVLIFPNIKLLNRKKGDVAQNGGLAAAAPEKKAAAGNAAL